jgi:hypothetical protein
MVIHVENEPDFRFLTEQRKKLIDVLKVIFLELKNNEENLPIYGVKKSNLAQFEKFAADVRKGEKSKEPPDENRLEEEDLLKMNLDDAVFIGYGEDEEDSDQDAQYEIKEEVKAEVDIIDIDEMSPTIRQFREDAFGGLGSAMESGVISGLYSCGGSGGSPSSTGDIL